MPSNVFIIEDHPLMQRMTKEFLGRMPEVQVCGIAASAQEALDQLPATGVDLVLIDVSLPDMDGIRLVDQLCTRQPRLACLMLSGHQEHSYVQRALAAGARGYIAKGNPFELRTAIVQVLQGRIYLGKSLDINVQDTELPDPEIQNTEIQNMELQNIE